MKEDVQAAGLEAIKQAVLDVIGMAYDKGAAEAPAPTGTLTQEQLDAAVAAAQDVDAKVLADAQAAALASHDALQAALDAMTAKELVEEGAVADIATKIASVQAAFDKIKGLLFPPPVVVPDPVPVDPAPADPVPVDPAPADPVIPPSDSSQS